MNLSEAYLQLADTLLDQHRIPDVVSIHLPAPVDNPEKPDEFGFLFLADGTAAPFYTSLDDTLERLWQWVPPDHFKPAPVRTLLEGWRSDALEHRALALGAFNAMSQHVLAKSGWINTYQLKTHEKTDIMNASGCLGMVGYFAPLVEQRLARGQSILVVEKNPDRATPQAGLTIATNPEALQDCDNILCTASTLINNSLQDILKHKRPDAYLALIGPSGSGLPDVLFRYGVDEVGGFHVTDISQLKAALSKQQSWGKAGIKYRMTHTNYPGIDQLTR